MISIKSGDIVKVNGYNNGRQATVLRVESPVDIVVKMGHKSMHVPMSMLAVVSRNRHDELGRVVTPKINIGDRVKYVHVKTNVDYALDNDTPTRRYPNRYGFVTGIINHKRVNVLWEGKEIEKSENLSNIKWVPNGPNWFNSKTKIDKMTDPLNPDQGPEYE